jgi:hypothetical protein
MMAYVICIYISISIGQEKGTTPLHVAAKAGQLSQAELLVVYGADPGAEDSRGKTPVDYARCDSKLFQMKHCGRNQIMALKLYIFIFECDYTVCIYLN